jgi:molybdopterin/thiamine biosynthesis adenylyltransferase
VKKLDAAFVTQRAQKNKGPDGRTYLSLSTRSVQEAADQNECTLREVEILALRNQIIPERYQRNIGTVGIEGQVALLQSQVAVVGLGGLGGTVFEMLLRWGSGSLVIIDHDTFSDSNLNRQLLSNPARLGVPKVEVAKKRALEVNAASEVKSFFMAADEQNLPEALQGCSAVVDGLDNIRTRFVLEKACKKTGIPLIHGAVAGFMGQVSTICPGDRGLEALYGNSNVLEAGAESELGTPCVTPTAVAAWQATEVVKILLSWENTLRNKVLFFDLKDQIMTIVDLS